MLLKRYLIVLAGLFFTTFGFSQINFSIGYDGNYSSLDVVNDVVDRFNSNNDTLLTNNIPDIHFLHGIHFGVSYRPIDQVSLEVSTIRRFDSFTGTGIDLNTETEENYKILARHAVYSGGLELFIGKVGIGGSIDWNQIKYRYKAPSEDTQEVKKSYISNQLYLSIDWTINDVFGVRIKPYVQIPWSTPNLFSLEEILNPEDAPTQNPADFNQDFFSYGIKFIFYNGYQPY